MSEKLQIGPQSHLGLQDGTSCDVCLNLRFSRLRHNTILTRQLANPPEIDAIVSDFERIKMSSRKGCLTCRFVEKVAMNFDLVPDDDPLLQIIVRDNSNAVILSPSLAKTIQIFTPTGRPRAWEGLIIGQELSIRPNSPEAYAFIKTCLARCDQQHSICSPQKRDPPTRLIELDFSNPDLVQLIETTPSTRYNYIALSYCWGKAEVVKTTSKNYETMKRGIKISTLPRTIQDAIQVTRSLEQRHLWVDALCIIQDSASDWEIESSRMASVYSHSYLTIAVATSDSANEGFLHRIHVAGTDKAPFDMEWVSEGGQHSILSARRIPNLPLHMLYSEVDEKDTLPLFLRGWTLQESKLSRRLVTYTPHELWWNCLTESTCECGTLGMIKNEEKSFDFRSALSIQNPQESYRYWQLAVVEYTERKLTNHMDKLPAMSGIAKVIQDITQSQYVAGMWSGEFISSLAWRGPDCKVSSKFMTCAPSQYRGPTFSWVSTDEPIFFDNDGWDYEGSCAVIELQSTVMGKNPLGQVQNAHATLQGLMLQSTLHIVKKSFSPDDRSQDEYFVKLGGLGVRVYADTLLETFEFINSRGIAEKSVRRSPHGSKKTRATENTPVYLLYLGLSRGLESMTPKYRTMGRRYLVLGKSPVNSDKYERVGLACENFSTLEQYRQTPRHSQGFLEELITII